MVWILAFFSLTGYNFSFWVIIGLLRYLVEKLSLPPKNRKGRPAKLIREKEVAAIIPAHNEEKVIKRAIKALLRVLPRKNIYVASDYSTDRTVEIARSMGVRVLDIKPNLGKARALVYTMKHYRLLKRFKAIIINDADVEIDKSYLRRALPIFGDKKVAAVAPHGVARWGKYKFREVFFIAYRIRLWRIIQIGMRFGQTWKFTNVTFIVPGSLSLYRTSVLKKLEIDAPGLIIEDFNMTFELHKKKLGRIAYNPAIFGIHQDPYTLRDYIKQIRRWDLGFWQTVKRNGIWPSFFWLSTGSFLIELSLYAIFLLAVPVLIILFAVNSFHPLNIPVAASNLTITDLLVGVFVMDYLTTIIAAIAEKKPILLVYGIGFIFLRYIDAFVHLCTLPLAFIVRSKGTWTSPKRK
ncbi:glycosyltransferase family 2 protein [Candidatus Curtissbacteria bacterium]|nr:glycosyltransferase family 2 protein [Candidatus Curtissbacteria bacterium]